MFTIPFKGLHTPKLKQFPSWKTLVGHLFSYRLELERRFQILLKGCRLGVFSCFGKSKMS